jgi:phosphoribosylformylglycinamidine synthase
VTLWEIDIYPGPEQPDLSAGSIVSDAEDLGLREPLSVATAHGYLIEGDLTAAQANQLAQQLLSDGVVERTVVAQVGDDELSTPPNGRPCLIHVMPKPGVMDPVAQSTLRAIQDFSFPAQAVRTFRKYWLSELADAEVELLCEKILANDSIEQVVVGSLQLDQLQVGSTYEFQLNIVELSALDDEELERFSREGQLYLTLVEMQTIQQHFRDLQREPVDVELETIAQTWSEHCSHKTLAGRIAYRDERGERQFDNMLKETIFAATQEIRKQLGEDDWCVSVFEDNAGIVRFDEENNVVFKVETHNHPSALEPYGGANTGIGGVIRDPLGTGLGARPVCNTDVFCFAPPDTPLEDLPAGVLHPRRVMKGVVSGVRDYGNRMGIPTVNGALYFDPRYLGNPLVYCGNVGILPRNKSCKQPLPGDWIVAVGGRTGRDGIHGATFSSAELTSESEHLSGGAVQIGNAITEKMVMDVILMARDQGLYNAITDCGAGGFSSAVGEMGEKIGAEVWLEKAPLKYDGLTYTEIWISEAQERMVLSVPPENWQAFEQLCASEGVEATIIGKFVPTGRLCLKYQDQEVADLAMEFLHDGRPPVVRDAVYQPAEPQPLQTTAALTDAGQDLCRILGSLNVASKEWVIRQYDHEVQGGSVIKPLVGIDNDGPGDAAVVRPILGSPRALVVSCGMNPHYGAFDTYHMAASAIDEAVRNCVAVGADPQRIAILDNFCWGYTDRPETLGSLVRASLACYDLAVALQTPFISGKDSLNNEFSYLDDEGTKQTISIPPTLLISALGQIADARQCVTMDLKAAGNRLYQVGATHDELGGSHWTLVRDMDGGHVPKVNPELAKRTFLAIHQLIQRGGIAACHDLSEGGLAVAAAEMAFAGGLGLQLQLDQVPSEVSVETEHGCLVALFSESNTRFLCEVAETHQQAFEEVLEAAEIPFGLVGAVVDDDLLTITVSGKEASVAAGDQQLVLSETLEKLKASWQEPLKW